jgi:hypothetical protein
MPLDYPPRLNGVLPSSLDCPGLQGIACGLGSNIRDSYSHWMPSMSRNTADGMDEALG